MTPTELKRRVRKYKARVRAVPCRRGTTRDIGSDLQAEKNAYQKALEDVYLLLCGKTTAEDLMEQWGVFDWDSEKYHP